MSIEITDAMVEAAIDEAYRFTNCFSNWDEDGEHPDYVVRKMLEAALSAASPVQGEKK